MLRISLKRLILASTNAIGDSEWGSAEWKTSMHASLVSKGWAGAGGASCTVPAVRARALECGCSPSLDQRLRAAPCRIVLKMLRARPARGGGQGPVKCQSECSPPRHSARPASPTPPHIHLAAGTSWWIETCGRGSAEEESECRHRGHLAAGLRCAGGGHVGMAVRRGQGGSLPPQDILLGPGHSGSTKIHPRYTPGRALFSPGSQEKFGGGRSREGSQPWRAGPTAGDPW